MYVTRECEREDCDNDAIGRRKYCSDRCRERVADRRYTAGQSRHLGRDPSVEEQVEHQQRRLQKEELERTLVSLSRSEAKRIRYIEAIQSALAPFEPSQPLPFREHDGKTTVDWCIQVSDWHVGQKTPIETTSGMYEQTVAKTHEQVNSLLFALSSIFHEAQGKKVRRLWVPALGDIVEGDAMRPAQLRQIEMPVVKQVVDAYDLLTVFLGALLRLPGLEELIVDVIGGNHDRTTSKPGLAGLGETDYVDTFAWLIGAFLERAFGDDPRVTIKNWDTFFGTREFGGLRHVFEHGSSIRGGTGSYGGIPWYPIHNAARKYESLLGGVDMVWFGHYHVPYVIPLGQNGWVVGNGALPATSGYAQSQLKAIRRPQQWLVEFHETVGATKFEPLYADVELPQPGDIWRVGEEEVHDDNVAEGVRGGEGYSSGG